MLASEYLASFAPPIEKLPVILGPNITGWFGAEGGGKGAEGTLSIQSYSTWSCGSAAAPCHKVTIDASRSSSIYGASNTVQPKALIFNYIIKY